MSNTDQMYSIYGKPIKTLKCRTFLLVTFIVSLVPQTSLAQTVQASGDVSPFPSPNPAATWDVVYADLFVGQSGTGELIIEEGGDVTAYNTDSRAGYFGYNVGSNGTVAVSGTGSTFAKANSVFSYKLYIGYSGTGALTIDDGAIVSFSEGHIARNAGSQGSVTVSGSGSTWASSGYLMVGAFGLGAGVGTLNVASGGTVTSSYWSQIGTGSGSQGTVTVSGAGSSWTINGDTLNVGGNGGTGMLDISNGGAVSVTGGGSTVGSLASGSGAITVTNAGSSFANAGTLSVGAYGGVGTLTVSNGGMVTNTTGYIGRSDGSEGTVLVSGSGATWVNSGDLILGGESLSTASASSGTLTVEDGGSVAVGGSLKVWDGGVISLHGGSLQVDGDYMQTSAATLQLILNGVNDYNTLNVGGTLTLGGVLQLGLTGGYIPNAGDTFQLFEFNLISGSFNSIDAVELGEGLAWDYSQVAVSGMLSVIATAAVPEPSTYAMLGGVVVLGLVVTHRWRSTRLK